MALGGSASGYAQLISGTALVSGNISVSFPSPSLSTFYSVQT